MLKIMFTPRKKIYLTLLLLSLLIELPLLYWLKNNWYPFLIKPEPATYIEVEHYNFFYHDLNSDGCNEFFEIENNAESKNYNIKIYRYDSGSSQLINQWNFCCFIHINDLAFKDLDGDGWQEIVVFTNDEEYLYLSILNTMVNKEQFCMREQLISAPKNNPFTYWDVERLNPMFWDVDSDQYPELIFTVHSGLSLQPRGVYAFSLKSKKIIRRFEYHAGASTVTLQDVNNDHFKELIVTTYATDNWPDSSQYSDHWSWLFVLDKTFKLVTSPQRYGCPFSTLLPIKSQFLPAGKLILYFKESDSNIQLMRFDSLRLTKRISLPQAVDFYLTPKIDHDQPLLYLFYRSLPRVDVLDFNLSLVKQIKIPEIDNLNYVEYWEKGLGNKPNFIIGNITGLYFFNSNYDQLAWLPLNQSFIRTVSPVYQNRGQQAVELAVTTNDFFMRYQVQKNLFYASLPFIALLLFGFFYGFLLIAFVGVNKLQLYYSYLFFSMRKSDNAIIILNSRGRVVSYNKKVEQWFPISWHHYKPHYSTVFKEVPQILEAIDKVFKTVQAVKYPLRVESDQVLFYGEISITPFFSFFHYVHAYLVELRDNTEQILLERQQNWQQSIHSLVHDLKNPLAGLQLKVQTLYLKLRKNYPQVAVELNHDLEMAYSEIERIRQISKDFLKFTQLEKIHFNEIQVENFFKNIVGHFTSFRSEKLKINWEIKQNTPKIVYWDSRQVELLLHILIKNAIDALRGSGEIRIVISKDEKFFDFDKVIILVEDSGSGVPIQIRDKIFDPFFTTKKEGSGMGLAFARQIVSQHKGRIKLVSGGSRGARFLIELPVKPEIIKRKEE